jgi:hypothetical protein
LLKKINYFFWNRRKNFYDVFGRDNSTVLFLPFLDDFKYAQAYIYRLRAHTG